MNLGNRSHNRRLKTENEKAIEMSAQKRKFGIIINIGAFQCHDYTNRDHCRLCIVSSTSTNMTKKLNEY